LAVRLQKEWIKFSRENLEQISGHLGIYQLANPKKEIVYIGMADGRSRFGLRGELETWFDCPSLKFDRFRVEINMAYWTRYQELIQVFYNDFERLPEGNKEINVASLGRLRPG